MENEMITKTAEPMLDLSEQEATEILSFVTGNVAEINQLSLKIVEAQKAADKAKSKIKAAKKAAKEAKDQADERTSVHWYNRKATAINNVLDDVKKLAESQVDIAESQMVLADVQQRAAEAQELAFDFQKKLASTTAMMIKFSTASIATSRLVVRELEARMNGASKKELSDLARKELETVVYQIKAQQDIMSRQDQLTDIVRDMDERMIQQSEADAIRDEAIEAQIKKGTQRDVQILEHERNLKSQQRILTAQQQKDAEHDELFIRSAAKNDEQDNRLSGVETVNTQQDALLQEQNEKIEELKQTIQLLQKQKGNKITVYVAVALSAAALILSILQFII